MPPKSLQLIVYHSPLFAAHWALFIPSIGDPKLGQRIHADGSPATGFEVLNESNYDLRDCTQSYQVIDLSEVNDADVDRVAKLVPAPGKSLVSTSLPGSRRRIEVKNCQTWVRSVVGKLYEEGAVTEEAVQVVNQAPKN